MATRFYLTENTTPDVAPALSVGWGSSAAPFASRKMLTSPQASDTLTTVTGFAQSANNSRCHRQFVSEPMAAGNVFDTSVTYKAQVQVIQDVSTDNIKSRDHLRIVSEDGTTLRHEVLPGRTNHGPDTEWSTALENKTFINGDAGSGSYTTVAGDRLVWEQGGGNIAGTTPVGNGRYGSDSGAAGDLLENETDTATNLRPWFETSLTITFAAAGADATVTPAVIAATTSLPAMSASAGSTVSPASVSLVAGLPSAVSSAGSTVSPAVIAATTGIPAAALSAGATLAPGSIAVVVSVPDVTIESGSPATVTPATISLVTALPATSITADSTIAPSPIALIVSFPAPRIVIPVFRYLFTPPTHEVVAWETGRDDKGQRADQTWRHYDRGDRGKTVVRTNGDYATYINPLYTVLENADDIRLIDGTIGKAVFLGGHITEVTSAIKAELEAAGYTVEQEEVPQ